MALQKLQNLPKKNTLSWVLQEYGRIEKTIHILKWYENKNRRKRVSIQLNKGEAIHALREYIYFANKGKIRKKYYEDQQNQAMCLNLVTGFFDQSRIFSDDHLQTFDIKAFERQN